MKKLRITGEDINSFIESVKNRLKEELENKKVTADDINKFSIDDLQKNFNKPPEKAKKPTVYIKADCYLKMVELIMQSPVEISWHGLVKRDMNTNSYLIYDVLVFPQINSATTTTGDEEEFMKWQMELIKDEKFPYEDLRMHGHSHVNMSVFSSGVDDQYQKDILAKVEDGDYYLFLIMNKKLDICPLLYDFDQQIMFEKDDIKLEIVAQDKTLIKDWAKKEIEKKCKTYKPPIKKKPYEYHNNYYYDRTNSIIGADQEPIFKGGKIYGFK